MYNKPMGKHKKPNSQLRIIGGQWRGQKLAIADVPGLRPTGDRIRETLFNWLLQELQDAQCLDLFAGSGALGLEALSRGAVRVIMLEKNAAAARQLHEHCRQLQTRQAEVVEEDCIHWLQVNTLNKRSINIAFIDPPFAKTLWNEIFERLEASRLLADKALIYIEAPHQQPLSVPAGWTLYRGKETGSIGYYLYRFSVQAGNH